MKVLFLHNHKNDAGALLRSAACFPKHGVTLSAAPVTNEHDAQEHLRGEFDLLLLQIPAIYESALRCGRPVVLLERIDGAQLRASRHYLGRVAGVIKGYVFRYQAMYNTVFDRAHVKLLADAGVRAKCPQHSSEAPMPPLSKAELAKIHPGCGFGAWDYLAPCINTIVDFDAPRRYDVHFAGTVKYNHSEIETHRLQALRVAEAWGGKHPGRAIASAGRAIPRREYVLGLLRSKVVLCPWGWGEATHRDYEAMAMGAVVVKPDTSYVACWPKIYRPNETYVPCRPDFSDAHEKIAEVVDHWDDYREMRRRARLLVADAWQPERIAQYMASLLKTLSKGTE